MTGRRIDLGARVAHATNKVALTCFVAVDETALPKHPGGKSLVDELALKYTYNPLVKEWQTAEIVVSVVSVREWDGFHKETPYWLGTKSVSTRRNAASFPAGRQIIKGIIRCETVLCR